MEFTPYSDASKVVYERFESLRSKHQVNLETSMRGSNFIFDSVQLMYCKCHRVYFSRGGLHTDSSEWIKKKEKNNNKSKKYRR